MWEQTNFFQHKIFWCFSSHINIGLMFKVLDGSAQNLSKYFLQSSSRFYHSGVCIKASTMCWKGEFSSDPPVDSWEQAVPASQFSQLVVNTPNCWSTHGSFLNRPSENTEMLTTGVDAAPPTSYEVAIMGFTQERFTTVSFELGKCKRKQLRRSLKFADVFSFSWLSPPWY